MTWGERLLFDPSWGDFDMAVGSSVVSVFGGPADREAFGQTEDFTAAQVPARDFSAKERSRQQRLDEIRNLRDARQESTSARVRLRGLIDAHVANASSDWLEGIELLELSYQFGEEETARLPLLHRLHDSAQHDPAMAACIQDGITLAGSRSLGAR